MPTTSAVPNIQRKVSFVVGEVGRLTVQFLNDGVLESPVQVRLLVKPPNGRPSYIVTNTDLLEEGEGEFSYDLLFDGYGEWEWRWEGTEGLLAVAQGSQWVDRANVIVV